MMTTADSFFKCVGWVDQLKVRSDLAGAANELGLASGRVVGLTPYPACCAQQRGGHHNGGIVGPRMRTMASGRLTKMQPLPFIRIGRTIRYRLENLEQFLAMGQVRSKGGEA